MIFSPCLLGPKMPNFIFISNGCAVGSVAARGVGAARVWRLLRLHGRWLWMLRSVRCSSFWQARSQAKIPEGAKSFTMKSTRQGSNGGELLYFNYKGCKAKRHWVQLVQLHPMHPTGYGHGYRITSLQAHATTAIYGGKCK